MEEKTNIPRDKCENVNLSGTKQREKAARKCNILE